MNLKPKIAVIGLKGLPAFGGAAAVGANIIERLKDDYNFTVYSVSSHTDRKTDFYDGYYQIVFRKLPLKKLNVLYYYILSVIHSIFFSNYDLIHLHHRDAAFLILLLKIKYKVILTTHSAFHVVYKWRRFKYYLNFQTYIFTRFANIITCVSKQEQRDFKNKLKLDVLYIPNGITIIDENSLIAPNFSNYIFFAAGRIIEEKGLHILLMALKEINFNGKIIVAGDLEQSVEYKNIIINLTKGLDVYFTGLVKEKKELFGLLKNAKLFIFPSSTEAMSMMLLEAISLKVPILCSDIIGNRDILRDDEAIFFDPNDYLDLAKKISYALSNIEEIKELSKKAFNRMSEEFSWNKIAEYYKNAFETLLK